MTTAVNNIKEKVQNLPSLLRVALERQAKARIAIVKLETQIAKYEAENDTDDKISVNNSTDGILEDDLTLIKLESLLERLKLEVTEAEDRAELGFRASENKVTESHVKAAVGVDPDVIRLRHKHLDAKETFRIDKATLLREKQLARIEEQEKRFAERHSEGVQDEKLQKLHEKLQDANEELMLAEVEVLVANATLESYQMLVRID